MTDSQKSFLDLGAAKSGGDYKIMSASRMTKKTVVIGAFMAAACLLSPTLVSARTLHHLKVRRVVTLPRGASQYTATYYVPEFRGPAVPTWRYKATQSRCDDAYPMTESSPCGTATGGPVGGIN